MNFITDFPTNAFPLPNDSKATNELAAGGGSPVIPKNQRRTRFPLVTKEDIFQMLISMRQDPDDVIREFEKAYQAYVGANYAIATASGTSSLHLALVGAGVRPGDEVIVPAFTFIATAQAVVAAKAIPVFVDIDPETYCLNPRFVEAAISRKTRAIMPVHVHGLPADMDALGEICQKRHLALVEDASHAHSASFRGRIAGSIGTTAGQSLMADKNFPLGGEAGIAFFSTEEAFQRAKTFLIASGIDYRPSWISVAFGLSQLGRLPYYDEIRQRNARLLSDRLSKTQLFVPPYIPPQTVHAFNMYRIRIRPNVPGLEGIPIARVRGAVQELLQAEGVPVREWQNVPIPCHSPFQNRIGFGKGYPFSLSEREDFGYQRDNFPNVLTMLESTVVLCRELRSPIEYERVLAYAAAFEKVTARIDAIRELAQSRDFSPPYQRTARLG